MFGVLVLIAGTFVVSVALACVCIIVAYVIGEWQERNDDE